MGSLYKKKRSPFIWHGGYSNGVRFDRPIKPPIYPRALKTGKYNSREEAKGRGDWGEAERIDKEFEAKKTLGHERAPIHTSIRLEKAWLEFEYNNILLDEDTKNGYRNGFSKFSEYMQRDLSLSKITSNHIKGFIAYLRDTGYKKKTQKREDGSYKTVDKKYSRHTINSYVNVMRIFFSFCIEKEWLRRNPVQKNKKLNLKTAPKKVEAIPKETTQLILDYLLKRNIVHYRFIRLIHLTSLRKSDVISLRWENVNFDNGYIAKPIEKTDEELQLPLYGALHDFLNNFRQPKGYLFPTIRTENSTKFWERSLNRLGMQHYTLTQLRKRALTDMILKGLPFEYIHLFSGHTDPKVTWQHYISIKNLIDAKKLL